MFVYPWPETVTSLAEAGFTFTPDPIDMDGDLLVRLVAAGYDIMLRRHQPHQTRRERTRDGDAAFEYTLQISPGGRGFGQRG
jgi:hypothetical protein